MESVISVKNLAITYDGRIILEKISFDVEEGDFLVIFGENGSGKSSLIKALLALKSPSEGEIILGSGMKRNEIGYLPQAANIQQDFPASVYEVVLSGCLNKIGFRPFYSEKEKKLALKNIRLLGIEDLQKQCFRNLSGGQKQRVLLARALCSASKLLLLDEPVTGLDPSSTADFYDTICRLNKSGMAIIMVSHDVHSSLSVAKHILQLKGREAAFYGTPREFEMLGE